MVSEILRDSGVELLSFGALSGRGVASAGGALDQMVAKFPETARRHSQERRVTARPRRAVLHNPGWMTGVVHQVTNMRPI
jgi:hypothetical protein